MHQNILLIQDDPAHPTAVRETLVNLSDRSFQMEWVGRWREGLKQLADRENQNKERRDGIAAVLMALTWATRGEEPKQPARSYGPRERKAE
jgi:hypothetical protein